MSDTFLSFMNVNCWSFSLITVLVIWSAGPDYRRKRWLIAFQFSARLVRMARFVRSSFVAARARSHQRYFRYIAPSPRPLSRRQWRFGLPFPTISIRWALVVPENHMARRDPRPVSI